MNPSTAQPSGTAPVEEAFRPQARREARSTPTGGGVVAGALDGATAGFSIAGEEDPGAALDMGDAVGA